jgi:exodeoxyribonuclease VII small subunit
MAKHKQTFEEALKELENIVKKLESGDLPLEQALKTYEEGIQLVKLCSGKLDETEKRIQVLMQDRNGEITEIPFSEKDTVEK